MYVSILNSYQSHRTQCSFKRACFALPYQTSKSSPWTQLWRESLTSNSQTTLYSWYMPQVVANQIWELGLVDGRLSSTEMALTTETLVWHHEEGFITLLVSSLQSLVGFPIKTKTRWTGFRSQDSNLSLAGAEISNFQPAGPTADAYVFLLLSSTDFAHFWILTVFFGSLAWKSHPVGLFVLWRRLVALDVALPNLLKVKTRHD